MARPKKELDPPTDEERAAAERNSQALEGLLTLRRRLQSQIRHLGTLDDEHAVLEAERARGLDQATIHPKSPLKRLPVDVARADLSVRIANQRYVLDQLDKRLATPRFGDQVEAIRRKFSDTGVVQARSMGAVPTELLVRGSIVALYPLARSVAGISIANETRTAVESREGRTLLVAVATLREILPDAMLRTGPWREDSIMREGSRMLLPAMERVLQRAIGQARKEENRRGKRRPGQSGQAERGALLLEALMACEDCGADLIKKVHNAWKRNEMSGPYVSMASDLLLRRPSAMALNPEYVTRNSVHEPRGPS